MSTQMKYEKKYVSLDLTADAFVETKEELAVPLNGSKPFTVEAWIRCSGLCSHMGILEKQGVFSFGLNAGLLSLDLAGFPTLTATKEDAIDTGDWYHVAAVWDGAGKAGTLFLYIDGREVAQQWMEGQPVTHNPYPYTIGTSFQGLLKSVSVFVGALPSWRIKQDQFMPFPAQPPLAADFDFSVAPPQDRSPNKLPLVLKNDAVSRLTFPGARLAGTAYCRPVRDTAVNPGGGGKDSYSVQAWVYMEVDNPLQQMILVNSNLESSSGIALYLKYHKEKKGFVLVSQRGGPENCVESSTLVPISRWNYLATTYDGASEELKVWVDGKEAGAKKIGGIEPQKSSNLLVGAAFVEGKPAGDSTFQGFIGSVRVWSVALTAHELIKWSQAEDVLLPGLVAYYNFFSAPARNQVNGNPIGLTDGAALGRQVEKTDGSLDNLRALTDDEQLGGDEIILDEQTLAEIRASIDFSGLSEQVQSFQAVLEEDLRDESLEKWIPKADRAWFREEAMREWQQLATTLREDPLSAGLVTSHVLHGYRVLLYHDKVSSRVLLSAKADQVDECLFWKLEMLGTWVSGILSVAGIYGLAYDKLSEFFKKILAKTAVMKILASATSTQGISPTGLYQGVKALHDYGLLWPAIYGLLTNFNWWAVAALAAEILTWLLPSALAKVVVKLGWAAFTLSQVWKKRPKDCKFA